MFHLFENPLSLGQMAICLFVSLAYLAVILILLRTSIIRDIRRFFSVSIVTIEQPTRIVARRNVYRPQRRPRADYFNPDLNALETPDFINPKRISQVERLY